MWATLLLQWDQVSVRAISCRWQRRNEEACFAVCQLWHCGALGDPAWVANVAMPYQKFVNMYKLYPGSDAERCWSITDMDKLVDFNGRDLIAHQLRQIPWGVYHNNDLSHHEKSHLCSRTKLCLCLRLEVKHDPKGSITIQVGGGILVSTNWEHWHFIQIRMNQIKWSFCPWFWSWESKSLGLSFFTSFTGSLRCISGLVRTTFRVVFEMFYHTLMCLSHSSMP